MCWTTLDDCIAVHSALFCPGPASAADHKCFTNCWKTQERQKVQSLACAILVADLLITWHTHLLITQVRIAKKSSITVTNLPPLADVPTLTDWLTPFVCYTHDVFICTYFVDKITSRSSLTFCLSLHFLKSGAFSCHSDGSANSRGVKPAENNDRGSPTNSEQTLPNWLSCHYLHRQQHRQTAKERESN